MATYTWNKASNIPNIISKDLDTSVNICRIYVDNDIKKKNKT